MLNVLQKNIKYIADKILNIVQKKHVEYGAEKHNTVEKNMK